MVSVYNIRAVNKIRASQGMQQPKLRIINGALQRPQGALGWQVTSVTTLQIPLNLKPGARISAQASFFSNTSSELVLRKGGSVKDCKENQNTPVHTLSDSVR